MNEIIQKSKEMQGSFHGKEPRKITISNEIEISEDGAENELAVVHFNIPLSIRLCGRRDLTEYERITVEDLRTKAGTLFELIEFFGDQLRSDSGYYTTTLGEFIYVASVIGQSLMEATESIETDFERYFRNQDKTEVKSEVKSEVTQ